MLCKKISRGINFPRDYKRTDFMKPFKGGFDPACVLCDEECCFGCEVASREIDPDYDYEEREEEDK